MKIVVLVYQDFDITEGISDLIHRYPDAEVLLPMTGFPQACASVITAAEIHGVHTTLLVGDISQVPPPPALHEEPWRNTAVAPLVASPHDEAIRQVDHGDAVVFAWGFENLNEVDADRAYLEDFGVSKWDVTDGCVSMDDGAFDEALDEGSTMLREILDDVAMNLTTYIDMVVRQTVEHLMSERGIDPDARS